MSILGNIRALASSYGNMFGQIGDLITQNTNHALQMLHLQQRSDRAMEAVTTRSNLQKAKHEAMMNIANNMK